MKLLLDQNLSPQLVLTLRDVLPNSIHVRDIGLAAASDEEVWEYAKCNGLTIVSKDDDFRERVRLKGHPPRVILIRIGNCSTKALEAAIRKNIAQIEQLHSNADASLLLISPDATLWLLRHTSDH